MNVSVPPTACAPLGQGSRCITRAWPRAFIAVLLAPVALAACADTADSQAEATSPGSVAESVAQTTPTTATQAAPTPTTATPATEVADTTSTTVQVPNNQNTDEYEPVDDRQLPSLSGGKSAPILSPLPDGTYWSWTYESDGSSVDFTLSQYFTGDACTEQFGDGEGSCASDNDTLYEPSAVVSMSAGQASVTVIVNNGQGGVDAYRVSPTEFARLVAGAPAGDEAPEGFSFQSAPVIVSVRDGQVVGVDQILTS